MSGPGAGFEYPSQEVSWMKRDVLLFANSIGCTVDELHFLYELHPSFQTFPTYPIILPFKHTDQEVIDFYNRSAATPIPNVPKFDSRRVVDGQRSMTFLKPLPPTSAGKNFELRSTVLGVYDKGKAGTVIETETILAERGGDIYTKALGSAFFVGQGNWGGPKGPSTVNYPTPEGKKPDAVHTLQTTKESAHISGSMVITTLFMPPQNQVRRWDLVVPLCMDFSHGIRLVMAYCRCLVMVILRI